MKEELTALHKYFLAVSLKKRDLDEYTRECLALPVKRNLNSMDVVDTLGKMVIMNLLMENSGMNF